MRAVIRALVISVLFTAPLAAQDTTRVTHRGEIIGISVGLPAYQGQTLPELATVGFNWTQVQPGRLGFDFAVGTAPRVLPFTPAFAARAGLVLPIEISPNVTLLPGAGVSAIRVGSGTAYGLNAGLAAVISGSGRVGFKTGLTVHRFRYDTNNALLAEAGIVWAY